MSFHCSWKYKCAGHPHRWLRQSVSLHRLKRQRSTNNYSARWMPSKWRLNSSRDKSGRLSTPPQPVCCHRRMRRRTATKSRQTIRTPRIARIGGRVDPEVAGDDQFRTIGRRSHGKPAVRGRAGECPRLSVSRAGNRNCERNNGQKLHGNPSQISSHKKKFPSTLLLRVSPCPS